MDDFTKKFIKDSSIKLPDGGDTHFHNWSNKKGVTVTTRLPGGIDFHDDFDVNGKF
ncbi:MAG: hypothetical protein JW801_08005 [Bacteroidales bacterium]|nr:hypothetical protein [Bacteroidales bacterium]